MNNVIETLNGPVLWAVALITVGIVIVQAVLIYRVTRKHAKDDGILTPEEIRICLKTGGITAVGPAAAVFLLALSMISMLGAPTTLMRVGIIGSADTEMLVASMGAAIAGVTLGTEDLTYAALGTALLACAITSAGYLILTPLISRGLGTRLKKAFSQEPGQKQSLLSILLSAVLPILIFSALAAMQIAQGLDYLAVMLLSAAVMFFLNRLSKARNITWLKEWAMGLSILVGIICGSLAAPLF